MASDTPRGYIPRPDSDPAFDPFRRTERHDAYELLKKVVLTPLIPVRFLAGLVLVVTFYLIVLALGPPLPSSSKAKKSTEDDDEDIPLWRRNFIVSSGKVLARCLLFTMGFLSVKVTIVSDADNDAKSTTTSETSVADSLDKPRTEPTTSTDKPDAPKPPPAASHLHPLGVLAAHSTLVANHVAIFDILVMMHLAMPAFVAKAAVARIPFVGRVAVGMQSLFVDRLARRGDAVQRGEGTVDRVGAHQRKAMAKEGVARMLLFPEGTTTNGKYILPFKTGAFVAGTPVAPVVIKYPYKYWPPSYETVDILPYIYGVYTQFCHYIEVTLLPVYVPSEEEKKNPKLYAENVRRKIAKIGGFEMSDSDYIEKLEYHAILKGTPPPQAVIDRRMATGQEARPAGAGI